MASSKVSALTADVSVDGTETALVIDSGTEKKMAISVIRDYVNKIRVPGYVSGNYYHGWPVNATATSAALSANVTYCTPFRIWQSVTISQLAGRVVAAGTNIQFGIYANSNGRPSGPCLAKCSSIAAAATTNVSGAISGGTLHSAGTATLPAGVYWFCVAVDNGTTTVLSGSTGAQVFGALIGSATLGNILTSSGAQPCYGVSAPDNFGTWSDWTTPPTFTELTTTNFNKVALPIFKVA